MGDCDDAEDGGEFSIVGSDGTTLLLALGTSPDSRAGEDLASGLDIDGDGLDDFVIGAPATNDAGAAYLVSGAETGQLDLDDADAVLLGDASGDAFGNDVALLDDIDGDGVSEVAATAYGYGTAGLFRVWDAPAGWNPAPDLEIEGATAGEMLVRGIDAGDLDGDGLTDLLLSAPGAGSASAGKVYVLYGPVTASGALSADGSRSGVDDADYAGYEVAALGDATGDGLPDLAVAAPYADDGGTDAGIVYLVEGPASGDSSLSGSFATFVGEEADDSAGWGLAGGDVDGNGYADLLIGAPGSDLGADDAGCAYLVLTPAAGRVDLSMADARFLGANADDGAGRAVALGDLDGDGLADLVTGARGVDDGGTDAGAAYVVWGLGL